MELFLKVQRRWSETAAAEMSGESAENTVRRWSMPWDCRHVTDWPRQEIKTRLRVPLQDRSRSTTPDSVWKSATMTSQDGLREAIQLLSCKPGTTKLIIFFYYLNSIRLQFFSTMYFSIFYIFINSYIIIFIPIDSSNLILFLCNKILRDTNLKFEPKRIN